MRADLRYFSEAGSVFFFFTCVCVQGGSMWREEGGKQKQNVPDVQPPQTETAKTA